MRNCRDFSRLSARAKLKKNNNDLFICQNDKWKQTNNMCFDKLKF